jgi:hemolysin type calcium-binding protein
MKLPIAVLLAALALPATAGAATTTRVDTSGSTLLVRVTEDAGNLDNENQVSLRFEAPGAIVVSGLPGPVPVSSACTSRSASEVVCTGSFTAVSARLGRGNDSISLTGLTDKGAVPTTVDGGAGNDQLVGGPGDDTLNGDGVSADGTVPASPGNEGDDLLVGNGGNDTLTGGPQHDALVSSSTLAGGSGEHNLLDGGPGGDVFDLGLGLGADEVRGGETGEGSNSEHPYKSTLGLVFARTNGDLVTYERRTFPSTGTAGVSVDFDSTADDGAPGEGDLIREAEDISGSVRNDTLTADNAFNRIFGMLGRDKVFALGGDDLIELRDGIQDDCPSAGTGTNTIRADLVDEDTFDDCVVNQPPPKGGTSGSTIIFIPVDDPTVPAEIGAGLELAARGVRVPLRCPKSPQARCRGTVEVLGDRARYSIRRGSRKSVLVPLSRKEHRRLRRRGRAEVTLVERGPSDKGPKEVRADRVVSA